MRKRIPAIALCAAAAALLVWAQQQSDIQIKIAKGEEIPIAVPDLRGSGEAQQYMSAFNQTLWSDLEGSGLFKMVSKSLYPLRVPQQPQDFQAGPPPGRPAYARTAPQGLLLGDWAGPPVNTTYLALGYTAAQAGQIVLRGWLFNVTQANVSSAQVFGQTYLAPLSEEGARKVAHDFAADILKKFGGASLEGTHIYYVSQRGPVVKEIFSMESDGSAQKQITRFGSTSLSPAVSPDGTRLAFTSFYRITPAIVVFSLETGRVLPFYNERASLTGTPAFTPDGQRIVFASSISGWSQIYSANLDGTGMRRISYSKAIDIEPKVNPKTGNEIVFVSGRGGHPQLYRMSMEGTDAQLLTSGEGDAVNPSWHPDGRHVAFSWTRGFAPGNYNVFIMDVATRQFVQLTHGAGRNEHPSWAPDGRHLVFASNRSGSNQIHTMLADGTQVKQLTTQGRNEMPEWGK